VGIRQAVGPVAGFATVFVLVFGYLSLPGTPKPTGAAPPPSATVLPTVAPSASPTPIDLPTSSPAPASPTAPARPAASTATPAANPPQASPTVPARPTASPIATVAANGGWEVMTQANAPAPRYHQTAVWTGHDLIVWGGTSYFGFYQDGARYNPATKTWTPLSTTNAPSPRSLHAAVWTGTEMIVWGGTHGRPRSAFGADGGSYNPATNTWTPLPPSPLRPRIGAAAVWTGEDVIIWGGFGGTDARAEFFGDGARYNPKTKTWTLLPAAGAPSPRWGHSLVWTGHDVLVWGGEGGTSGAPLNDGARFEPAANRWSSLPTAGAPSPRTYHGTAWTGKEMIVWGGQGAGVLYRDGGRFDPATGAWTRLPLAGAPSARESPGAFWTGTGLVVWGGNDAQSQPAWDGARYNPTSNTWSALPAAPLAPRLEASTAWDGHALFVWGGTTDDESGVIPLITPHNDGMFLRL
jgi:hypothetical protein